MKKRRFIGIGLGLLILLGVAYWLSRPEEAAVYRGKNAWQWAWQLYAAEPQTRDEAATALREMGTNAVPLLLAKLRAKESLPRKVRLWLGEKLPERMGKAITKDLEMISFESVHNMAASGLGAVGTNASAAVPELIRAMQGPEVQTTWDAATALGKIGEEATLALVPLLDDARIQVRQAAATALSQMGAKALAAVPALVRHLDDPDINVQTTARAALGGIGPQAGPAVLKAVEQNRGAVRRTAARALVVIHPRNALALPVLAEMANDPEAESRATALSTMAELRINHTNALAVYRQALGDSNALVRAAGVRALGEVFWKTRGDVPQLASLQTNDSDEAVRLAAQKAVEKILSFGTNHPATP